MRSRTGLALLLAGLFSVSGSIAWPREAAAPDDGLAKAIYEGDLEDVVELLGEQANVNQVLSRTGYAPLHLAALGDQLEIAQWLLARGAIVDITEPQGFTIQPRFSLDGMSHWRTAPTSKTPLFLAVESGSFDVAQFLLSQGACTDFKDGYDRNTPLHVAAKQGDEDIIDLLLSSGADINPENENGETPLRLAALEGRSEVVQHLVDNGATYSLLDAAVLCNLQEARRIVDASPGAIEEQDKSGRGVLHLAAQQGSKDLVSFFIQQGLKVNQRDQAGSTPLHFAVESGHPEVARLLLENGARVNSRRAFLQTALHIAAPQGDSEMVKLLLEHGADPNLHDQHGETALFWAAAEGDDKVVDLLLQHGAECSIFGAAVLGDATRARALLDDEPELVNDRDFGRRSPLHYACEHNHPSLVGLLLERGAPINAVDMAGEAPIHIAAASGYEQIIDLLLSSGAMADLESIITGQPIHAAAYEGHLPVVKLLVEHGVNLNAEATYLFQEGMTPLHLAAAGGHLKVVECLIAQQANVNARNGQGETPLVLAERAEEPEIVEVLLAHGALRAPGPEAQLAFLSIHRLVESASAEVISSRLAADPEQVNVRDEWGRTPLHVAAESGKTEIGQVLLDCGAILDATVHTGRSDELERWFGPRAPAEVLEPTPVSGLDRLVRRGTIDRMMPSLGFISSLTFGMTPLEIASKRRHFDFARLLLERGANPNGSDPCYSSPLEVAIQEGERDLIELLLRAGAVVNPPSDCCGSPPLTEAARQGDLELVQRLLELGAEANPRGMYVEPPLVGAVEGGNMNIVHLLLDEGAAIIPEGTHFHSAFHTAATEGNNEVMKLFLSHGVDVNSVLMHGLTALHLAAMQGDTEMVELLLSAGAEIDLVNKSNGTPLHEAVVRCREEVIEVLLSKGANVNARNEEGIAPLHFVVSSCWDGSEAARIAYILIDAGADVHARGGEPQLTPLSGAGFWDHDEVARALIEAGADVNAKGEDAVTALHCATLTSLGEKVARVLLEHGADVHARTLSDGKTPLHTAAENSSLETVKLLISYCADPCAKDHSGKTPLEYAEQNVHFLVLPYLEELVSCDE